MNPLRQQAPSPTGASPLEGIQQWPSERSRRWLAAFLADAVADPAVQAVLAVGSSVRSVARSNDLDLLVLREDGEMPSPRGRPIEVDLRVYDTQKVGELIAAGHDLLNWAVRFGVVLYEKNGYWSELRRHWRNRLPWPSPGVALKRAETSERLVRDLLTMGDEDAAHEQLVTLLTHHARAVLLRSRTYPASRPELPSQLEAVGEDRLARLLQQAIDRARPTAEVFAQWSSELASSATDRMAS